MSGKLVITFHFFIIFIFLLPLWLNPQPKKYYDPEVKRILQETGWFEFVDKNIDRIEYYPGEDFISEDADHKQTLAVGENYYCRRCIRRAKIAVGCHDALYICHTLVHEAGHVVFWQTHEVDKSLRAESEEYAVFASNLFMLKYATIQSEKLNAYLFPVSP